MISQQTAQEHLRAADPRPRGATAVEVALVLPLLMTLAFGAVDFGRVLGLSAEFSNAMWAGAEYGATYRPSTLAYNSWMAGCQAAVMNELSDANDFDTSQVTISVDLLTDPLGNQQVQITGSYQFTTIVQWPFIPKVIPLQSQVTMRQYR